jgi:four helix bundle protein
VPRSSAKSFQEVIAWQKAHGLVLSVYALTARFPSHETFGLRAQVRRAAVSVPANIAEGFKRKGSGDKSRFFNIAAASGRGRYFLILANELGYIDTAAVQVQADEVARVLHAYWRNLEAS